MSLRNADGEEVSTLLEGVGIAVIKAYPNPSLLMVEDNGDISKPDRIYRALGDNVEEILVIEANEIFDVLDAQDGAILASYPQRGFIAKLSSEGQSVYASGLPEPTQMSQTEKHLYVISGDGLKVVRMDANGNMESIQVSDYLNIDSVPTHPRRTFMVLDDKTMILAVGGTVNKLNPQQLDWVTFNAK